MSKKKVFAVTASAVLTATCATAHAATSTPMSAQQMQQFMQQVSAEMTQMHNQVASLQGQVKDLKAQLKQAQTSNKGKTTVINKTVYVNNDHTGLVGGLHEGEAPNYQDVSQMQQRASTEATLASSSSTTPTVPAYKVGQVPVIGLPVFTSPYLGIDKAYDGSDLIVNQSSVNLDLHLLKQRQAIANALEIPGQDFPQRSTINLSGKIEVQGIANQTVSDGNSTTLNLSTAELDSYILLNPHVSGFMSFVYDNTANSPSPNPIPNSRIYLNDGFITLGNLDSSPFYATIGQLYLPFGQYGSYMLSSPATQILGRVQQRAVVGGYHPNDGLFASGYIFNGEADVSGGAAGGGTVGYTFLDGSNDAVLSLGAISDIAESQGLQNLGGPASIPFTGFAATSETENLDHGVPGLAVNASADVGSYSFIGEYVASTRAFAETDLSFNGRGAQPTALHLEAVKHFTICSKPSTFGFGLDHTTQAIGLLLPENTYLTVLNVSPWRSTVASLELKYQENYGAGDTASGAGGPVFHPLFRNAVTLTGQFGIYF